MLWHRFALIVQSAESDAVSGSRQGTSPDIPPQIQDDVTSWLPEEPDFILVALDENYDGKDEVRMGYAYGKSEFMLTFLNAQQQWVSGTAARALNPQR